MPESKPPDGHPMDVIAEQFNPPAASPQGPTEVSIDVADDPQAAPLSTRQAKVQAIAEPFSLSLQRIAAPAFFVDRHLRFRWMAPDGSDPFSLALQSATAADDTGHIFKLLANRIVQESITDWQTLFTFIYTILRQNSGKEGFADDADRLCALDHGDRVTDVADCWGTLPFTVESCLLDDVLQDIPWRLYGLVLEQGALFILRQDPWHRRPDAGPVANRGESAAGVKPPTVCVLAAQLDESHRISDAMLPDGFLEWMKRVWDAADGVAATFGGVRSGRAGSRVFYEFKEIMATESIFKAIRCATRLNGRMQQLEKQFLAQGEWADDIRLNIGISHGDDSPADGTPSHDMVNMIPGGAADQASQLAGVATAGEIWITKRTAAGLAAHHIRQVVLGIDHQGRFLRNRFARLNDLPQFRHTGRPAPETGMLSIARIVGIEPPGANQPTPSEVPS
jgi:class 3 adenylate cyclase